MSIAYYMDHNVDDRIANGLRSRGIDVLMAREDGREEEVDPSLLDRATELGRVFYTHDKDFLREAARRQREGIPFPGVIYSDQFAYIGACIESLELISEAEDMEYMMNNLEYVPL